MKEEVRKSGRAGMRRRDSEGKGDWERKGMREEKCRQKEDIMLCSWD